MIDFEFYEADAIAEWSKTFVLEYAHSGFISSASLWLKPSMQGHIIIADGTTVLIQHASCPAPETISL